MGNLARIGEVPSRFLPRRSPPRRSWMERLKKSWQGAANPGGAPAGIHSDSRLRHPAVVVESPFEPPAAGACEGIDPFFCDASSTSSISSSDSGSVFPLRRRSVGHVATGIAFGEGGEVRRGIDTDMASEVHSGRRVSCACRRPDTDEPQPQDDVEFFWAVESSSIPMKRNLLHEMPLWSTFDLCSDQHGIGPGTLILERQRTMS